MATIINDPVAAFQLVPKPNPLSRYLQIKLSWSLKHDCKFYCFVITADAIKLT